MRFLDSDVGDLTLRLVGTPALKPGDKFDCVVLVPPSHRRALQPVIFLAEGIGTNAMTDELLGPGKAAAVRALMITKTRSSH